MVRHRFTNPSLLGVTVLILFTHSSQDAVCFKTEHRVGGETKWGYTEQLVVPFDSYALRALATAIDPTTNRSVHIARFMVTGSVGSFVVLSRDTDVSESTYNLGKGRLASRAGSRVLDVEIKRSKISRTFMLSLALLNWLLVIGSVHITALVASGKIEASNGLALLPFSIMVTIPAVRALYAEPPSLSTSLGTLHIPQSTFSPFNPLSLQIPQASLSNLWP